MKHLPAVLILSLTLAACGHSPPTQFYTLEAVPPAHSDVRANGTVVTVDNVIVPAALDRLSIVVHSTSGQLDVSDQSRWAAPLDGMVRRVLAEDLRQRLGPDRVLLPGDPLPSGPVTTVLLNLQSFTGNRDGNVVLDCDWSVQDRRQKVQTIRHVHLTRRTDGRDIGSIVRAQSDLLGALSDDIATYLRS